MLETVTRDLLAALAGTPGPSVSPKVGNDDEVFRELTASTSSGTFDVERWLNDHDVRFVRKEPWNGGSKWILAVCPWNSEHTASNKAMVGQLPNGAIVAKCQHASCAGKKWQDLRDVYEPGWREAAASFKPLEAANDPHRLARNFLETECSHPEGHILRYSSGSWYGWQDFVYVEEPGDEVEARLAKSIKQEFDRASMEAQRKGDGKRVVSRQVTNGIVSNVKLALRGQILVPSNLGQPCWIGEAGPWAASDVLPAVNGLFYIPSLVDGIANHLEPTPRYFTKFALDYPITLDAPQPVSWLGFLDQLWPNDPQCIAALQEFMGYVLTQDTSQQKMLMLIGPPRSGKGVIARVATGLIGSRNVAGISLTSLRGPFGLETLLDKALAIIPDARLRGQTDSVAERVLSITGEDLQTIERKHRTSLILKLPTRLMMMSNELPRFDDASGAIVSRMILLRMKESYLGREDRTLTQRCLTERGGILIWSLAGLRRLHERGHFIQPDSANELLSTMEEMNSPVGEFVRERCKIGPFLKVPRSELYAEYLKWCEQTGRKYPEAPSTFGRSLYAAVKHLGTSQPREGDERTRMYEGIALASP